MIDKDSFTEDVRRIEALFRFGAALPPRDSLDEAFYCEWHARDERRSSRRIYGRHLHLRNYTSAELHHMAVDNAEAHAERAAKLKAEAEAEAGF